MGRRQATTRLYAKNDFRAAAPSGRRHLTTGHLGSTRLVTRQDKSIDRRIDYLPFGELMPADVGGRTTALKYDAADAAAWMASQSD